MKKSFILILFLSIFLFTRSAEARLLPQAGKLGKQATTTKSTGTGISVYPKLRADRRALTVGFSNLQNAKAVSYALTYNTSVQPEGAIGSLNLNNLTNTSVELLFGTCSKNVCRYHQGINNARLEVTYTNKSGSKYIKRFKIRV